jgi:hypothetical protein
MKTNVMLAAAVFATAFFATGAAAQTTAPTVSQIPPPTAVVSPASPMPTPNSIIYIPRLPTPAELSNAAAVQGLSIEKMEQTGDHITVLYRYADGQFNTVAYQLLPTPGAGGPAPATPAAVVPAATTTVVYPAPSYYYYDPFYYPWPWPWFGPVSFRVGVGYGYGHFRGGYIGAGHGFRHHGGGHGFRHR